VKRDVYRLKKEVVHSMTEQVRRREGDDSDNGSGRQAVGTFHAGHSSSSQDGQLQLHFYFLSERGDG
jgi:hypothetical protein